MSRLIYVVHEMPVTTQTFVEAEMAAMHHANQPVHYYALHGQYGGKLREWSTSQAVRPSPLAVLRILPRLGSYIYHTRGVTPIRRRSAHYWSRRLFSVYHAIRLSVALNQLRDDAHLHAHFLGRCLDVTNIASHLYNGDVKTSATAHASDAYNPIDPALLAIKLKELSVVVAASQSVADALSRLQPAISPVVVHCGVEPKPATTKDFSVDGRASIVSVGRLVEKKGFSTCLRAAALLKSSGFAFHWTIVGGGQLRSTLEQLRDELGLGEDVTFFGHTDNCTVQQLLREDAHLFVLPCKMDSNGETDGIPVVLMESMSWGVPVITTDIAGISELVQHEHSGLLVEPNDANAIFEYITRLRRDSELYATLSRNGRMMVEGAFDITVEAQKLAGIFKSL